MQYGSQANKKHFSTCFSTNILLVDRPFMVGDNELSPTITPTHEESSMREWRLSLGPDMGPARRNVPNPCRALQHTLIHACCLTDFPSALWHDTKKESCALHFRVCLSNVEGTTQEVFVQKGKHKHNYGPIHAIMDEHKGILDKYMTWIGPTHFRIGPILIRIGPILIRIGPILWAFHKWLCHCDTKFKTVGMAGVQF